MPRGPALLLVVVLVGALLRFIGLDFGFPVDMRPDEGTIYGTTIDLARRPDWNPRVFFYPGLAFYLPLGAFHAAHATERIWNPTISPRSFDSFLDDQVACRLAMRVVSALLGTLTLFLAYRIGARISGAVAGLAAASLLAVSFLHVRDSHFGTTDVPATFFVALAIDAMTSAVFSRRLAAFALSGVFVGIAAAIKYLPGVLLLPVLVAVCIVARTSVQGHRLRYALLGCSLASLCTFAAFLVASPYTLLAFDEFSRGFSTQIQQSLGAGFDPASTLPMILGDGLPTALGLPLAIASGVGLLFALFRGSVASRLVVASILTYLAVLSAWNLTLYRYLIPLLPLLCVLAGCLCADLPTLFDLRRRDRLAAVPGRPALAIGESPPVVRPPLTHARTIFLVLVLGADPLLRSIALDRLFVRESTFELAHGVISSQPGNPLVCAPSGTRLGAHGFVALDPSSWPEGRDVLILLARHPHPVIGDEWATLKAVIESFPSAKKLLEVRAFKDADSNQTRFEFADWFLYPVAGFGGVERGGPDLLLYRIDRS